MYDDGIVKRNLMTIIVVEILKSFKMSFKSAIYILLIAKFILLAPHCFSQRVSSNSEKHKIGFSIGYGDQEMNLIALGVDLQVDYSYKVLFAQVNYIYSFFNDDIWDIGFNLQSEYGITSYKSNSRILTDSRSFEFGVSGGVIFSYKLSKEKLNLYLLLSAGPHYSEKSPERQFPGFMFNNNFDIGINYLIKDNLHFDMRTGFRHLSNAALKYPNGGLNNWVLILGLLYEFDDEAEDEIY